LPQKTHIKAADSGEASERQPRRPIRVRIRADAEVVGRLNIDNRKNAAKCGRRCA